MSTNKKFNWFDALSILGAIGTFGVGWIADNKSTMVAFLSVGIVYLLRLASIKFGYVPSKAVLTVIVFLVAFGLSFIIKQTVFPAFPVWSGDASTFTPLLIAFASAILQAISGVVAYAMGVYNILLAKVLEKLPNVIGVAVSVLPVILISIFLLM